MMLVFHSLYLFSTGSLLLITFLLISKPKKANRKANLWLSLFLFCLFLIFLEESIKILSLPDGDSMIEEVLSLPLFVIAPTFYLSIRYFTNPHEKLRGKLWLHLLPLGFFIVFIMAVSFLPDEKRATLSPQFWGDFISVTIIVLLFIQILSYLLLCLKTIRIHQKNIRRFASNAEEIDLLWLQRLIYGVVFMVLLWIAQVLFSDLPDFTSLGYFLAIYYLAYFALNQKEIYPFTEEEIIDIIQIVDKKEDSSDKSMSSPDLSAERDRLSELMEKEKLYLDNELSLPKLAEVFQTSTHQLSFLLNKGFNENFYDYVNRHRVEESKKLLMNRKFNHLSIVGIAFEAGFNSKTAFNTAFKKFTGQTPTEFRKANIKA